MSSYGCLVRPTLTPFESAIETIELSDQKKRIILHRYVPLLEQLKGRTTRLTIVFQSARAVITVGSLIVPALLSIQYTGTSDYQNSTIYWATWVISLCVTICNGLLTLFKLDKHYYHIHTVYEHLTSEGWQYISLTAKYSRFNAPAVPPTHENQFIYFCHSIEKIRMKQIEEEFYKINETSSNTSNHPPTTAVEQSLIPPTPQKGFIDTIPADIVKVINEQKSRATVEDAGGKEDTKSKEDGSQKPVSVSFDL